MDHLWSVIQEAAKASQPHQILFVFQLKANTIYNFFKTKDVFSKGVSNGSVCLAYLAGDIIDVVAVHQLGCDGQRDQLSSVVVVFLLVPQLGKTREQREVMNRIHNLNPLSSRNSNGDKNVRTSLRCSWFILTCLMSGVS